MSRVQFFGMDLSDMEVTTAEQADGLRKYYQATKNTAMPEYEFWLRHRPDVAKRRMIFNMMCRSEEGRQYALPSILGWIAYYSVQGYSDGVLYQVVNAQAMGAPKATVLDAFAFAQLFADLRRMRCVPESADTYLATYVEPASRQVFPDGWAVDPEALASGLDFGSPELTADEGEKLRSWYRRNLGELPPYVERMLESQPRLLKAYRNRFEHALRAVPKQVMPYLMLHLNLLLGYREGVREALLLGRGFGMTREQLMDGVGRMVSYGGVAAVSLAAEVGADVFASHET